MNENKLIEVCALCGCASCWYGEFLCNESKHAGTKLKTVKELRLLGLEHEENWSDEKMLKIYGESAPHGFVDSEDEEEDLMNEPLEDLLEQVFSGSYVRGETEDAIRAKVKELKSHQISKEIVLRIVDDCFLVFAPIHRVEAKELTERILQKEIDQHD